MFSGGKGEEGTINSFSFLSLTKRISSRNKMLITLSKTRSLAKQGSLKSFFFLMSPKQKKKDLKSFETGIPKEKVGRVGKNVFIGSCFFKRF